MNMKEKMAKMRASKAKKQATKKVTEEKPIKKVEQKGAIAKTMPPEGKQFLTSAPVDPQPKFKSWKVKLDMGMMPEEQYTYFFHYILPELRKAARVGKKIIGFSWDEQRRLIPEYAKEEAFE